MKKIAIVQSNYIPWKGYFDMIASVDEFVLYDDMQYTRRDWRNRNKIKTPQGPAWITVPVNVKGRYHQEIRETEIAEPGWAANHWQLLQQNYRRAGHFDAVAQWLAPLYLDTPYTHLSQLNRRFIEAICRYLGITTRITNSWDYQASGRKSDRLLDICQQADASVYVSGPAAKDYLDEALFNDAKVAVEWFSYDGYPSYPQLWGEFCHHVSIVDLLFNCGPESARFMRHV